MSRAEFASKLIDLIQMPSDGKEFVDNADYMYERLISAAIAVREFKRRIVLHMGPTA